LARPIANFCKSRSVMKTAARPIITGVSTAKMLDNIEQLRRRRRQSPTNQLTISSMLEANGQFAENSV
jgi:hypothetical protein